jgi:hypothetical protein
MQKAIENMQEIIAHCRANEPVPLDLLQWLAEILDDFLARRTETIEEGMGLVNARGGVPWRIEAGMRARDAALRELAARHCPCATATAAAQQIGVLALRYAASAWRFDGEREAMPPHYEGKPEEWLWRAFKSGAAMPLGERQLRKILG